MAIAAFLASTAQGHVLQHGNIVADHGSGADDKTGRMIEENAFADPGCRMNIGLEYLG